MNLDLFSKYKNYCITSTPKYQQLYFSEQEEIVLGGIMFVKYQNGFTWGKKDDNGNLKLFQYENDAFDSNALIFYYGATRTLIINDQMYVEYNKVLRNPKPQKASDYYWKKVFRCMRSP